MFCTPHAQIISCRIRPWDKSTYPSIEGKAAKDEVNPSMDDPNF